jgi:hypothetical protein
MAVSIHQQITEVIRELKMRAQVYPRLVNNGKLTQATSDRQIDALEAVLATLRTIGEGNRCQPNTPASTVSKASPPLLSSNRPTTDAA